MLSLLVTGYFLKIAKINSQREKPTCPRRKKLVSTKQKKNSSPQKQTPVKISWHTVRPPSFFCIGHLLSLSCIYSLSSDSLMRSVGWGVVSGMRMPVFLLLFIRCQRSVLVKFSFSYNTYLFLSSLSFTAAQYTPSGV